MNELARILVPLVCFAFAISNYSDWKQHRIVLNLIFAIGLTAGGLLYLIFGE